jgi:phage/plasmid primase-like uncharacterized protein
MIKQKLSELGIDPSHIKVNATTSAKSIHGSVWIKNYSLTIRDFLFNILIIGSYSGLELGEDGQRVLTLWEPVNELPDGILDPLDIIREIDKGTKEIDSKQKKEKAVLNEQVAKEAAKYIEELCSTGHVNQVESPYLKRKNITPQKDVYVDMQGNVIVPMIGERQFLWNYQRITPEGDKYFLTGGRISGCYHVVAHGTSNTIFIGEGYVTCASVAMAFRDQNKRVMVVCAFNSSNMPHVVRAIKALHPNKKIVILADNDQWKEKNTGIITAQKCGESFVTPFFDLEDPKVQELKPTDFNDLHNLTSLGEVYRQVTGAIQALVEKEKKKQELAITGDDETEISVARKLIDHFGDSICACGEDLFLWDQSNGYWKHLEKGNFQAIMQIIVRFFGDAATDKKVRGAFNLFRISIHQISDDIFTQKKHLCNFKNGTLVLQNGQINLRPHDKRDLLTYSLPLLCPLNVASDPVDGTYLPPPGLFKDLLTQVTENDPEKLTMLSQMFGALLFPLHPQIFFILGDPNNGKSTIAKVALNLVGIQNCSSVSPNRLFGFNLHQTMGKRVNYDLDIPTKFPLSDDTLKKVIDQVPIQIERKNKDSVQASLPPVHLYVGNDLPTLGEGNAKPFERRVSFIKVTAKEVTVPIRDLHEQILTKELEHVLRFAIAGSLSLVKSKGAYQQTESKKTALIDWELASSSEKDFIDLLTTDGVPVYDEDGVFTGSRMYKGEGKTVRPLVFSSAKRMYGKDFKKSLLTKALLNAGHMVHPVGGQYYFIGLEIREPEKELI